MAIDKALKMDLPALAEMLRSKGRGKDTILAHITPKEAALLKRRGGSGTTNPDTGLPEYEDSFDYSFDTPAPVSPVYDIAQPGGAFTQVSEGQGQQYTPGGAGYAPISDIPAPTEQTYSAAQGQAPTISAQYAGAVPAGQALPTGGTAYSPTTLTPLQLGQTAVGESPYAQVEAPAAPTTPTQAAPKDFTTQLKEALTPTNLAKLGLVGALGAYGANRARLGGKQTQAATQQEQNIASPYQEQGKSLTGAALRGELTPASQQAYDAAKAQVNQGIASRGGVGTQQAANQLANIYQTLLNNQYTYGLQVSQIGDNIALGAIKTGLQLDQALNQATTGFYTQLAALAAGATVIPSGTPVRA